ncbi:hypothetical protein G3R49_12295 [Shewanella sp. WXL01]|uniref:hypothetical protein n=1 Tax=Shewanella sp. WXL01 TaxID=2709721 RepID=UPI0014382B04|nr:hypothetical protein [Shewanella sp. WXL01]NKF51337.1 hypothetical protein [Shewanella sp. WXL01]
MTKLTQLQKELAKKLPMLMDTINSELGLPKGSTLFDITLNPKGTDNPEWVVMDEFPNYQQSIHTGLIRSRKTHRLLSPTKSGYVSLMKNGVKHHVKQGY